MDVHHLPVSRTTVDFMHALKKRRISILLTVVVVAAVVGVSVFGAAIGDTERIGSMWISARLQPGGLAVTEVIDYDFGPQQRHGIFRDIPDLAPGSRVEVISPTAPDTFDVIQRPTDTRVKIGDPNQTISGRHRYRISFMLSRDAVLDGGQFAWDAVGNEWPVGIHDIEIHLDLGSGARSLICRQGAAWSEDPCDIVTETGGDAVVRIDSLGTGSGVTVFGVAGSTLGPFPAPPTGPAVDPGTGILKTAWMAAIAASIAAAAAAIAVRRAGREQVWSGGAAVAAFGPDSPNAAIERIDERKLGDLATIEFEAPRGMSAVEGAVLIDESVKDHHLAAWLLESAIRGEIDIEGDMDDATLVRTDSPAHPTAEPVLRRMFHGRERLRLDDYDSYFAAGWQLMKGDITHWKRGASYWDRTGHRRQNIVRVLGLISTVLGLGITTIGAALSNRNGDGWLTFLIVGAALAGVGAGVLIHSWELLIRSPDGSARWLQVESFRRFLHESEAHHVEQAAERGVLREYTAWAVALDEADRWTLAVSAANRADPSMQTRLGNDLMFIAIGSSLSRSASHAHTKPSSSGGGGGFSGGGGGGGGGGSW